MNFRHVLALATLTAIAAPSQAAPIMPSYDAFGTLAGATFGGSGIPNTAVATTAVGGPTAGGPVLGLTAHQRYAAAPVTNNGAGVFSAFAGVSVDAPSPANPYATWNFGFYIGGSNLTSYVYQLFYDFAPGAGTDQSAHGYTSTVAPGVVTTTAQGSWNLGMDFLETSAMVPGVGQVVAPGGTFDPTVGGEYTFALVAYTSGPGGLTEADRVAIQVNVAGPQQTVPVPGTLALAGLALVGLGALSRKNRG